MLTKESQYSTPSILGSFAADLADPESEISQFTDEFFIHYLLSQVELDKQDEILTKWNNLESEEEQDQFLNQLKPDFYNHFQEELFKELVEVFKK